MAARRARRVSVRVVVYLPRGMRELVELRVLGTTEQSISDYVRSLIAQDLRDARPKKDVPPAAPRA